MIGTCFLLRGGADRTAHRHIHGPPRNDPARKHPVRRRQRRRGPRGHVRRLRQGDGACGATEVRPVDALHCVTLLPSRSVLIPERLLRSVLGSVRHPRQPKLLSSILARLLLSLRLRVYVQMFCPRAANGIMHLCIRTRTETKDPYSLASCVPFQRPDEVFSKGG